MVIQTIDPSNITQSVRAASQKIPQLQTELEDVKASAKKAGEAELVDSIKKVEEKLEKLGANLIDLEKIQAEREKKITGRLFTLGQLQFGWEDVILFLALMIIVVSWLRGDMDFQSALVALLGTGAGGAWGHISGKNSG